MRPDLPEPLAAPSFFSQSDCYRVSQTDWTISTYLDQAASFAATYERLSSEKALGAAQDLLPFGAGRLALDIGAGSGATRLG